MTLAQYLEELKAWFSNIKSVEDLKSQLIKLEEEYNPEEINYSFRISSTIQSLSIEHKGIYVETINGIKGYLWDFSKQDLLIWQINTEGLTKTVYGNITYFRLEV